MRSPAQLQSAASTTSPSEANSPAETASRSSSASSGSTFTTTLLDSVMMLLEQEHKPGKGGAQLARLRRPRHSKARLFNFAFSGLKFRPEFGDGDDRGGHLRGEDQFLRPSRPGG